MSGHAMINIILPFEYRYTTRTERAIADRLAKPESILPIEGVRSQLDAAACIHFMSISIVPPLSPADSERPSRDAVRMRKGKSAHLIIEMTSDVDLDDSIRLLLNALRDGLNDVVSATGTRFENLFALLRAHSRFVHPGWCLGTLGLAFDGSPGMTVDRICRERELASKLTGSIDAHNADPEWLRASPRQRLEILRNEYWSCGEYKWAFVPEPARCMDADPHSSWNLDLDLRRNPQARNALAQIVFNMLWPLFLFWSVSTAGIVACATAFDISWLRFAAYPVEGKAWVVGTNALIASAVLGILAYRVVAPPVKYPWRSVFLYATPVAALVGVLFQIGKPHLLSWALVVLAASLLLLTVLLAFFLVPAYGYLRKLEKSDLPDVEQPRQDRVMHFMAREDVCPQNHLATVSRIKPGLFRALMLRLGLTSVAAGTLLSAPGFLGRNSAIHFARWIRIPGTDQLVFLSNYDGTWPSYVVDFIAEAPGGVTAIWSNCTGFPRTRNLYFSGADDRDYLVRWARRQQFPTLLWYSAYPDVTTERMRINAAIRQGLTSALSEADCRDWFDLFGSRPRQPGSLDKAQISTLVFGGLKRLPKGKCVALQFEAGPHAVREWLRRVLPLVTYGEVASGTRRAAVLGISSAGLRHLGVKDDALATFPVAFQHGMQNRARALGDLDDRDGQADGQGRQTEGPPWTWGVKGEFEHAVLLLYAATDLDLHHLELDITAGIPAKIMTIDMEPLNSKEVPPGARTFRRAVGLSTDATGSRNPYIIEPFGFVDGVSQPAINGLSSRAVAINQADRVEPGEFVLGYPDNLRKIPPPPKLLAADDPETWLPTLGPDPMRRRPEFSRYEGSGFRDIGVNGTFLVVRQLRQHQDVFEQFLDDAESSVQSTAAPHLLREQIAAKLVGRWRGGQSLVACPNSPLGDDGRPLPPDNDFLYGELDAEGAACPFGAHMRRANPRDSRKPGSLEEIRNVNRHRILRRGRNYKSTEGVGLLFICLNADIERQFEFVQRTWLLNQHMHGLDNEVDPIIGKPGRFTIPSWEGDTLELNREQRFVQCVGGAYCFVPGKAFLTFLAHGMQ